jgi:hypothetical protein
MKQKLVADFSSERAFDIFDAEAGHHFLLVRSSGGEHNVNIDLIFGGVLFVELPSSLFGIKISKPCDEKALELEKRFTTYQAAEYKGEFVYALESQGNRFHIVASALWIHENTLPTSSLIPMCKDRKVEEYYANYVKKEYKLG